MAAEVEHVSLPFQCYRNAVDIDGHDFDIARVEFIETALETP